MIPIKNMLDGRWYCRNWGTGEICDSRALFKEPLQLRNPLIFKTKRENKTLLKNCSLMTMKFIVHVFIKQRHKDKEFSVRDHIFDEEAII